MKRRAAMLRQRPAGNMLRRTSITDIAQTSRNFRVVPIPEVRDLFDDLVGAGEQRLWHGEVKCLGSSA